MVKTKHLDELHADHKAWRSQLQMMQDEMTVYTRRLEEVVAKNNTPEAAAAAEAYQNKFLMWNDEAQALRAEVRSQEHQLAELAVTNPDHAHQLRVADHDALRSKVESLLKVYGDTRADYQRYLAQWL